MDSAHVGIFEETNQVSFTGLLQSHDGRALETEIGLEILGDFTHKTLETELPDERIGGFLVTPDLSKSYT